MKNKKTIYFALLAACTSLMASAQSTVPTGMEMTAHEWCKNVVAGWNLGNTFESCAVDWNNEDWSWPDGKTYDQRLDWEISWMEEGQKHYTTQADIKAVAAAGFNAIRIPVRWEPHVKNHETMEIDATWLARIKEVVDWCMAEDMYVLLNTHHEKWLESNPFYSTQDKINDMLGKLWTQIAEAFADYDGRLAFAGVNEVHLEDQWGQPASENVDVLNSYHRTFVKAVRDTGGKNLYRNLVVQTYVCNPDFGITVPEDVVNDRLSVEFHYYQPWNYCGLGIDYKWTNVSELERVMDKAKNTWWNKGFGVIIGEYGCVRHFDPAASPEEQEKQLLNTAFYNKSICSIMRERGFAGFVWDNYQFGNGEEQFGIFNRSEDMRVDNKYAMAGIVEGSGITKTNVPDLPVVPGGTPAVSDLEPYTGPGTVIWSGKGTLNWGDGLQLTLQSDNFASLESGSHLELHYTSTGSGIVQLFDGWWSNPNTLEFKDAQGNTGHEFNLNGSSHCLDLSITDATLTTLKQKGLVIQGTDAVLQRVVVVNASDVSGDDPNDDPQNPGTDPEDPDDDPENPDTDPENPDDEPSAGQTLWFENLTGGQYAWKGSKALDWGQGVEVSSQSFASLTASTDDNQIIVLYEITSPSDSKVQFLFVNDSWKWQELPIICHEILDMEVNCSTNTASQAGRDIMVVNIPSSAVETLRTHNMVIQGVGTTIKGIMVLNADSLKALPQGDVNADQQVNVADVVTIIDYLMQPQKADWMLNTNKADVDGNPGIDASDVEAIVQLMLQGE